MNRIKRPLWFNERVKASAIRLASACTIALMLKLAYPNKSIFYYSGCVVACLIWEPIYIFWPQIKFFITKFKS
jgi:hypothetical protein